MTTRLLPLAEWSKIEASGLGAATLPHEAMVLVVEHEGAIVGCWALYQAWHADGMWVAPNHRGRGAVFRRLVKGMRALLRSLGTTKVVTSAIDPKIARLVTRSGAVKVPGEFYVLE